MPSLQGVIKLGDKASESKCTLVYGQMNEPPGARARVALTGEPARGLMASVQSLPAMSAHVDPPLQKGPLLQPLCCFLWQLVGGQTLGFCSLACLHSV